MNRSSTSACRVPGATCFAIVQRAMAAMLLRAGTRVYYSTETWKRLLAPYGPQTHVEVLPIPATIPADVAGRGDRARARPARRRVRHRPLRHLRRSRRARARRAFCRRFSAGCRRARPARRTRRRDVRAPPAAETSAIVSTRPGRLTGAEAAAALRACDLLVQPYPDGVTTRRTSVMAALTTSVPVLTTDGPLTEPVWARDFRGRARAGRRCAGPGRDRPRGSPPIRRRGRPSARADASSTTRSSRSTSRSRGCAGERTAAVRSCSSATIPTIRASGRPRCFYKLREEFQALGHTCDVVWTHDIGARPASRQIRQLVSPWMAGPAIARRMGERRYDVVDAASAEGLLVGLRGLRRRRDRAAFICRSNGLEHLNYARMIDDHSPGSAGSRGCAGSGTRPAGCLRSPPPRALADRLLVLNEVRSRIRARPRMAAARTRHRRAARNLRSFPRRGAFGRCPARRGAALLRQLGLHKGTPYLCTAHEPAARAAATGAPHGARSRTVRRDRAR